jgi:hypothetical protein
MDEGHAYEGLLGTCPDRDVLAQAPESHVADRPGRGGGGGGGIHRGECRTPFVGASGGGRGPHFYPRLIGPAGPRRVHEELNPRPAGHRSSERSGIDGDDSAGPHCGDTDHSFATGHDNHDVGTGSDRSPIDDHDHGTHHFDDGPSGGIAGVSSRLNLLRPVLMIP